MKVQDLYNMIADSSGYSTAGENTQYKLFEEGTTLWVLFQETDGKRDWLHNLFFLPIPVKPYKRMTNGMWFAHAGFLKLYKSAADAITEDICVKIDASMKTNTPITTIRCAGWSEGAALAILASEDLNYKFIISKDEKYAKYNITNIKSGFGYGTPRPVFILFHKNFMKNCPHMNLFQNETDWVTKVPFKFLGFFDTHRQIHTGKKFSIFKLHKIRDSHTGYGTAKYDIENTNDYD